MYVFKDLNKKTTVCYHSKITSHLLAFDSKVYSVRVDCAAYCCVTNSSAYIVCV